MVNSTASLPAQALCSLGLRH